MDWDMETTSVVIVGAGFSAAATDGKMPLMTGFFDRLTKEDFPDLFEFVTEAAKGVRTLFCARFEFFVRERGIDAVLPGRGYGVGPCVRW